MLKNDLGGIAIWVGLAAVFYMAFLATSASQATNDTADTAEVSDTAE